MTNIPSYFVQDTSLQASLGITLYIFDDTNAQTFVSDCLVPFRQAYISEEKISENMNKTGSTRSEEIAEQLPQKENIKSGDFGEILTYYMATEVLRTIVNVKPRPWRFKD